MISLNKYSVNNNKLNHNYKGIMVWWKRICSLNQLSICILTLKYYNTFGYTSHHYQNKNHNTNNNNLIINIINRCNYHNFGDNKTILSTNY